MGHIANIRAALRRQKAIDDPLLNRLGLQVARTAAAHGLMRLRRGSKPTSAPVAEWVRTLRDQGCVVVPDFLPPEVFEAIRATAESLLEPGAVPRDVLPQGGNQLDIVWRSDVAPERRAVLDQFFCDPRVLELAAAAERIEVAPGAGRCLLQHLVQHEGEPDLEAGLHSDTFFPTHKIWLYLTDVTEADGPLVYYPRSHRVTATTLRAVYHESTTENAGSRRIRPEEIDRSGVEPKVFTCGANTLVMADTFGFHGRIQGRPPGQRTALQIELRPDPFRRGRAMAPDHSVSSETQRQRAAV